MVRRALRLSVTVAAVAGLAGAVSAAGAGAPVLSLGGTFTLATDGGLGPGATALGADGTIWLATYVTSGPGSDVFVIAARSLSGRTLGPVSITAPTGFTSGQPVLSVSGGSATVAWLVAKPVKGGFTVALRSVRCDIRRCQRVVTLSSWQQLGQGPTPVLVGAYGLPGIATADGHTVVGFFRNSGGHEQMWWSQTGGDGRFGAPRAITMTGPAVPIGLADPVLVPESRGRILAVWGQNPNQSSFDLGWAVWTASRGFATTGTIAGGKGFFTTFAPVVAAVGNGAAVAWIQGTNSTDAFQEAEPAWLARQTATGFTAPTEIFNGDAAGLSLAGGDGVLALAFNSVAPGFDADQGGPAMVMRSIDGAPFTAPVQLAASAAPSPAVSVDTSGDTIAVWYRESLGTAQLSHTQVAIAPPHGSFGAPRTLGPGSRGDYLGGEPTVSTVNRRTLITWLDTGEATEYGALATP
jgi:hypothetical protein